MQEAHLYSSPASVGTWERDNRETFTLTALSRLIADTYCYTTVIPDKHRHINVTCGTIVHSPDQRLSSDAIVLVVESKHI